MTTTIASSENWPNRTRPNANAKIPYGYRPSESDPLILVADDEIVRLVDEAMDYLDAGHSYREASRWLTEKSGASISHQGIANIWKRCRGDKNPRISELKKDKRKRAPKTAGARELAALKRKEAGAKRSLTVTKKKLNKLKGEPSLPLDSVVLGETPSFSDTLDFEATLKDDPREVVFRPNKGPQTEFLAASEREVLYGGAAGGGKSYGLLADPMRYFANPNFNGLILRRTNDELRELIFKSQELYPKAYPGAKWQEKKSQWTFPSGARLWVTYLERDEDVLRYQGLAFSYIAFDELTQYASPFAWNYMRSRLRSVDPTLPLFMRATTNPGGRGHQWVKKAFIDPSPANKSFDATDPETGEVLRYPEGHAKAGKALFQRRFIPATLKDNPYLYAEGDYETNLLSLPEMQRRQLLEGDWAVADGAAFPEFKLAHHVIEPFDIPHDWRRFRSCDYGYSSYSAVHWFAIDPSYETLIVYRELYLTKHTSKDLGAAVMEAERGESIAYGVLDSSCWHQRGQLGPSIAEEMINMGVRWRPSDRSAGSRVAGRNRLHQLLKYDEATQTSGIMFFDTCRQIISDLPTIPSDPKGGDDIDVRYASDHTYDSLRYGIQSRPRSVSIFEDWKTSDNQWQPASSNFGY
jgi:hypothetical protein